MYERPSLEVELADCRARLEELVRTRRPSERTRGEWSTYHDLQRRIRSLEITLSLSAKAAS